MRASCVSMSVVAFVRESGESICTSILLVVTDEKRAVKEMPDYEQGSADREGQDNAVG